MDTPKLYIDLDGVLADFTARVSEIVGRHVEEFTNKLWRDIEPYIKDGSFWPLLPKMKGADKLWNACKKHDLTVLTACGTIEPDRTAKEKRKWVLKHFNHSKVLVVTSANDKKKFAAPNHILIDDRLKAIDPWKLAGGIGVHHRNVDDTIEELEEVINGLSSLHSN